MSMNDFRITKGMNSINKNKMEPVTHNTAFCSELLNKSKIISSFADESIYGSENTLVYAINSNGIESETLQMIIDLLMQLRAAQDGQNVILNTNTLVKQQIIDQIKREFTQVQGNLTKNQIQQFSAIYNNNIDEKALSDLIASLINNTKKKLDNSLQGRINLSEPKILLGKDILNYSNLNKNIINTQNRYQTILSNIVDNVSIEKLFNKNKIVHKKENVKELIEKKNLEIKNIISNQTNRKYKNLYINNLTEQQNNIYQEKLVKKTNLLSKTIDKNTESVTYQNINRNEEIIRNISDRLLIQKYNPKKLVSNKIINSEVEIENKNVLINDKHSLYSFVKNQSEKNTIYDSITNIFNDRLIKSKNVEKFHREINSFENRLLDKYKYVLHDNKANVYLKNIDRVIELVNKKDVKETYVDNENIYLNNKEKIDIKKEINKYYQETLAKDKKITKRNVTNVDVKKLLKGNITEEIVKESNIITHYNDLSNKTVNKVLLKNYSILRNIPKEEIINNKSIERYSNTINRVHNRIVNSKLEKIYDQNTNDLSKIENKYSKVFKINRNITSKNKDLRTKNIENIIHDTFVNKTELINKKDIKNISQEEYLSEIVKYEQRNLEEKIEKKYKNKSFNIDTSFKNNIIKKEIENSVNRRHNQIKTDIINNKSIENVFLDRNLINREKINKSQIENIELSLNNISNKTLITNIEKKYRNKVNNQERTLEKKLIKTVKTLDDIKLNTNNRIINKDIDNVEIRNVLNRQIENHDRIIRKSDSILNEIVIDEKINNISDKIIRDLSVINTVRNNLKNVDKTLINKETLKSRNNIINDIIINNDKILVNKKIINENKINSKAKKISKSLIENLSIVNEVKDKISAAERAYNVIEKKYSESIDYLVPEILQRDITNVYNVDKIVNRKKINLLSPEIISHRESKLRENDIYNNTVENQRIYYNDMIEDIGRSYVVRDNQITNVENFHERLKKEDIIYKSPIKLPEIKEVIEKKESKNQRRDGKKEKELTKDYRVPINFGSNKKKEESKGITKKEVEDIIKSYIGDINVDNISRVIMGKVESKMRLDRRRSGIM